jgi:hypothetical protein
MTTQTLETPPKTDRLRLTAKAAEQWQALDADSQDRLRELLRRISGGVLPGEPPSQAAAVWQVPLVPGADRVATFERRDDFGGTEDRGPVYVVSLADHVIALVRAGDDLIIAGIQ